MTIDLLINILVVIGFVIILALLYTKGKVILVKASLYELVAKCEVLISVEDGDDINYDVLIDKVYPRLPIVIRVFITDKELDSILHHLVGELKAYLKDTKET